ncbi:MAG: efflux RND transporter periplasmic adaptor subunit [Spirochaetota bacterium]
MSSESVPGTERSELAERRPERPGAVRASSGGPKRRLVTVTVVALVVLTFLGVPAARFLLQPEPVVETAPPTPVLLGSPFRADAERTVRYTGNLTPEATTSVLPKVSGTITRLAVRENQPVSRGDVIAQIEDEVLQLQAAQARAAYQAADAQYRQAVRGVRSQELEITRARVEQAEAALETARSNLDRTERLFEADAVSRREYEEARDRFQAAETDVQNARRQLDIMEQGASSEEIAMARANADAAERRLDLARLQLDYATVTTPVAGTVARVFAEEGQTVGPQSPIVAIVNDRLIYAELNIPERLYGVFRAREGEMPARIYPEAYPDREPFVGTVTAVAPVIDAESRTFRVEVAVANADALLRPGMYVNAVFVLEAYPQALQVPTSAVHQSDGRTVVYSVDDGMAVAREVTVLDRDGESAIVLSGLDGVDAVIVEGAAFLADGDEVEVVGGP